MENLKKEYKLLIAIIVIVFVGLFLEYTLVSRKQDNTKKIVEELEDKQSQLSRDDAIQQKVFLSRDFYDNNVKSSENFTVVNTVFIERLQNLLSNSAIQYNPNDIEQLNTNAEVVENNLAFYSFSLSFTADYAAFLQFLKKMEQDKLIFDVVNMTVTKFKNEAVPVANADGTMSPPVQANAKTPVKVTMQIQISKFI